jgi:hypothetical protein
MRPRAFDPTNLLFLIGKIIFWRAAPARVDAMVSHRGGGKNIPWDRIPRVQPARFSLAKAGLWRKCHVPALS